MKKALLVLLGIIVVAIITLGLAVTVLPMLGIELTNPFQQEKDPGFVIESKVRIAGSEDKSWYDEVTAHVGDNVEVQIMYSNRSPGYHNNVALWANLPSYLEYVDGTTILFNNNYPDGTLVNEDEVANRGLYVGSYAGYEATGNTENKHGANAYLRFTVKVVQEPQQVELAAVIESVGSAGPDGEKPTMVKATNNVIIVIEGYDDNVDGSTDPATATGADSSGEETDPADTTPDTSGDNANNEPGNYGNPNLTTGN